MKLNIIILMATVLIAGAVHGQEKSIGRKRGILVRSVTPIQKLERINSKSVLGGTSSNGGGGDQKNPNWQYVKGFEGLAKFKETSYAEKMKGILDAGLPKRLNGAKYLESCSNRISDYNFKFFPIPDAYKDLFELYMRIEDGSVFKLGTPDICKLGNREIAEVYGYFTQSLTAINKYDKAGNHLIKRSAENKKIKVVFNSRRAIVKAKGGTIEEFTWFDHSTGTIHLAPRTLQQGIFHGRTRTQFLKNELAHVLIHQSYGDNYPNNQIWHDISAKDDNAFGSTWWMKSSTSNSAAFIEGLSNVLELGSLSNSNPNDQTTGRMVALYRNMNKALLVYFGIESVKVKNNQFFPPLDNEYYTTSALAFLLKGHSARTGIDQDLTISEGKFPVSSHSNLQAWSVVNVERSIALIDAIANHGPMNMVDLAISIDRELPVEKSNYGYRWLREFFFIDYKTGQNTFREFKRYESMNWRGRKERSYSIEVDKKDLFFRESVLRKEELEEDKLAEVEFAKSIKPEFLIKDIKSALDNCQNNLEAVEEIVMTFDQSIVTRAIEIERLEVGKMNKKENEVLVRKIYHELGKQKRLVSLMGIEQFLENTRKMEENAKSINDSLVIEVKTILTTEAVFGSEEHVQRVNSWRSLKRKLHGNLQRQIDEIFMTAILKEQK